MPYSVNSSLKPTGTLEFYESRDNAQQFGYTAATHPAHTDPGVTIFTVNYYDRYDFLGVPVIAEKSVIGSFRLPDGTAAESNQSNGLATASLTRILGTNNFLLSETLYDQKGRVSKVLAEHQLNGIDEITNTYNFAGELLSVNRKHHKDNTLALTVDKQHSYDHIGRITAVTEQINQQTPSVTKHTYNALGQLETKKVGNKTITQANNAGGWLSKLSSPLFSFSLYYDRPADLSQAQNNGNISEQIWITGEERTPYQYSYSNDKANRLQSGIGSGGYGESLTYDKMGNITSLVRTRQPQIDNNNVPKVGYLSSALGSKLTKQSPAEVRQYINGIEYVINGSSATIDLLHTEAGIARKSGATYHHEYFLKDHLGNTRVVYNTAGEVLQQTDYLPFGMEINRKIASVKMDYTYNGKEMQHELGQYDYGERFYDPVIARWNVVDPLAEISRRSSPYNYGNNNQ